MPMPSVEPKPPFCPDTLSRFFVPEDAHDASYLAASARIFSFCGIERAVISSCYVLILHLSLIQIANRVEPTISFSILDRSDRSTEPSPQNQERPDLPVTERR